jgi:DNA (cytosine-5)-methyltransferase 1
MDFGRPATFYEFFAGGGMARAGLGPFWNCVFANDNDPKKCRSYAENWGDDVLTVGDVAALKTDDLPGRADLAWASFPCQDLSLAGSGAGLNGRRSGTFWPFWRLVEGLRAENRAPRMVVLENVYGSLRSHQGRDFSAIADALASAGYRFGPLVIDAVHFVPQSRPRLFIVGVSLDLGLPEGVRSNAADSRWHPSAVIDAKANLNGVACGNWVWWRLGEPPRRSSEFAELIDEESPSLDWNSDAATRRLLGLMSARNLEKVEEAKKAGCRMVGGVYKRTRNGRQRAEVRFDVSGCLRTPVGGSSRQTILEVKADRIRSRLLSPREAARLMGLPDSYRLPASYNEAYHLVGDGLAVPVVRFLAQRLLGPIIGSESFRKGEEAA